MNELMKTDWESKLDTVKSMITNQLEKDCTISDSEFKYFIDVCKHLQLDPIKKEIWLIKYDQKRPAQVVVARDGYLAMANSNPDFDGMESGIKIIDDQIYGWCKVYVKSKSHAFYVEVPLSEYNKNNKFWNSMPKTQIIKVAENQTLRKAFGYYGIISEYECLPPEPTNTIVQSQNSSPVADSLQNSHNKISSSLPLLSESTATGEVTLSVKEIRENIARYCETNNISINDIKKLFQETYNKPTSKGTVKELSDFYEFITTHKTEGEK